MVAIGSSAEAERVAKCGRSAAPGKAPRWTAARTVPPIPRPSKPKRSNTQSPPAYRLLIRQASCPWRQARVAVPVFDERDQVRVELLRLLAVHEMAAVVDDDRNRA